MQKVGRPFGDGGGVGLVGGGVDVAVGVAPKELVFELLRWFRVGVEVVEDPLGEGFMDVDVDEVDAIHQVRRGAQRETVM